MESLINNLPFMILFIILIIVVIFFCFYTVKKGKNVSFKSKLFEITAGDKTETKKEQPKDSAKNVTTINIGGNVNESAVSVENNDSSIGINQNSISHTSIPFRNGKNSLEKNIQLFISGLKVHYDNYRENKDKISTKMYKDQISATKSEVKEYIRDLIINMNSNNCYDKSIPDYKVQIELYKYWLQEELYELYDKFEKILKTKCVARGKLDDFDMIIDEAVSSTFEQILSKLKDPIPTELSAINTSAVETMVKKGKSDYKVHVSNLMQTAMTLAKESYEEIKKEHAKFEKQAKEELEKNCEVDTETAWRIIKALESDN